jgi:hypothetical protein
MSADLSGRIIAFTIFIIQPPLEFWLTSAQTLVEALAQGFIRVFAKFG